MSLSRPRRHLRGDLAGVGLTLALALGAGCASKLSPLPTGTGSPFPDTLSAYAEATSQCRGVKTLRAELGLAGRAAGQKVRGRIVGGFAEPGQVRLEAPAPFGRPVFTLVMRGDSATLVLDRERRVLRDAPPAALLEALTGVALGADDLRAALAGCGLDPGPVSAGQLFPGDILLVAGSTTRSWLRRAGGAWRLVASARGALELRYDEFVSGRPSTVRLMTNAGQPTATDLTLRLSQVDINVALDAAVFELEAPADAAPLSLEELRRSGPLGGDSLEDALAGIPARYGPAGL